MEESIRSYVEELFMEAPNTRRAVEMKLELTEHLVEKYRDLLADNRSPGDAYQMTLMSIGNVQELFDSLEEDAFDAAVDGYQKRSAFLNGMAAMCLVLSFLPMLLFSNRLTFALMLMIDAVALGLLVYNHSISAGRRDREDFAARFHHWQKKAKNPLQLKGGLITMLWCVVTAIYFLLSIATGQWQITWVIFILGAALQGGLLVLFSLRDDEG